MTLDEQIAWLESERRALKKRLASAVIDDRITRERASYLLAVSLATLSTLTQFRGIVKGGLQ